MVFRICGGGDGKDKMMDGEQGASETEVPGPLERIMERQSEPRAAYQGFRRQIALALSLHVHGRQRRRRRHGNMTWHDIRGSRVDLFDVLLVFLYVYFSYLKGVFQCLGIW